MDLNKLQILVVLVVGLFLLILAGNLISDKRSERALEMLEEAWYEDMMHPDSHISHCFPNGIEDEACVLAWWDSVWLYHNLEEAQLAWGSCRDKINELDPAWFTDPWDKIEITIAVKAGGWRDPLPSKAEANRNANELIRYWNDRMPRLNCGFAGLRTN